MRVKFAAVTAVLVAALAAAYVSLVGDGFDAASIRDKRVLITGASSGIGEHLAYHYARLGARLVLTARREHLLKAVAAKCGELGARQVEYVPADMASAEDRSRVMVRAERHLGGLDHLVLNHASMRNDWWMSTAQNMTALRTDLEVNLFGFVDLASQALRMLSDSGGSIGVVTSVSGKMGLARSATYSATKFALHGFFSSWRQELNFRNAGVSVTLCVLGPIATERADEILKTSYPHLTFKDIGASPADTAEAIMRGVATRQYEIYYDLRARLLVLLHKLMPNWVENASTRFLLK